MLYKICKVFRKTSIFSVPKKLLKKTQVFIGKNLDKEYLEENFMACRVKDPRFKVGDVVEANVGFRTWSSGHWFVNTVQSFFLNVDILYIYIYIFFFLNIDK